MEPPATVRAQVRVVQVKAVQAMVSEMQAVLPKVTPTEVVERAMEEEAR
ncbi:hypothetical protein [Diaphorobacter caeni]|nr:hypothetical protein [Diaphorobacter caeni]MBF5003124.1 hypothetical protein [Diaphorobacter caeni]